MDAPYDLYDYVSYWKGRSYEDNSERIALEYFFYKIQIKKSIVDIGGGFGRLAPIYAKQFLRGIVLDPSEKNLSQGRDICQKFSNINFEKGSLPNLPYGNNQFDTALMIRVSHHLEDLCPSFKEIFRILNNNGYFILEVANKIHFYSKIKSLLRFNFGFSENLEPIEKRSRQSIKEEKITFVNHHPKKVISDLHKSGFKVLELLSVSNFRSPLLKIIIPLKVLLFFEKRVQKIFSKTFFGPSIFIICQKVEV